MRTMAFFLPPSLMGLFSSVCFIFTVSFGEWGEFVWEHRKRMMTDQKQSALFFSHWPVTNSHSRRRLPSYYCTQCCSPPPLSLQPNESYHSFECHGSLRIHVICGVVVLHESTVFLLYPHCQGGAGYLAFNGCILGVGGRICLC
jgi:hypothetical protein